MLKKSTFFMLAVFSSSALYADIPIESKELSNTTTASIPALTVPNTASTLPTNINWQLTQKTQELEKDIRILRGKIEEQDNEISQLKNELNNRYTDLDQRLELILQKVDPDDSSAAKEEENKENTVEAAKQPTIAKTKNSTEFNTTSAIQTATQQTPPSSNTDLDKAAYTVALDAYKQGGAQKAILPMQNFIKNNPNSIYVSNAYFWLAEFNLALEPTNYAAAKKNFEIVMKQYPNSSKAPSAIYRLYSIALNVDHNNQLANQYKADLLKRYPNAEEVKFIKNKKAAI